MKIEKIKKYKNKLLKLKLIQNKIYSKNQYLHNIKIEEIEYQIKKILYVIYKYHTLKKRILFIGPPLKNNNKIKSLIKLTQHIILPENIRLQGIIGNNPYWFKQFIKNKKKLNRNSVLKFKKNIDLIVILKNSNNSSILNEGYIAKIPTIALNCNFFNIHDTRPSYKIPNHFQFMNKKKLNHFFYSLFMAVLKKGNTVTVKNPKPYFIRSFSKRKPYIVKYAKKKK